jgi:hypothetical protein
MRGVVDIHIGIAEMQVEACAEIGVFGTAVDFFDSVGPEGVDGTETD